MRIASLAYCIILTGCASQIMESYMNDPLSSAVARYGPPFSAYDMGDGRRAFQWKYSGTSVVTMPSTTTGTMIAGNFYGEDGSCPEPDFWHPASGTTALVSCGIGEGLYGSGETQFRLHRRGYGALCRFCQLSSGSCTQKKSGAAVGQQPI